MHRIPAMLPDDARDLAGFGYRQELDRTLGRFSSFAAGFSYISILTGVFQTFYLGFGAGGRVFIWSWPVVLGGQFLVALVFAELASRYPLSGGAYQWSKLVGSPLLGWVVGWTYLACLVVTLAAVALALQATLPQISDWFEFVGSAGNSHDSAVNAVILGCVLHRGDDGGQCDWREPAGAREQHRRLFGADWRGRVDRAARRSRSAPAGHRPRVSRDAGRR